jgi:hypothetical protein
VRYAFALLAVCFLGNPAQAEAWLLYNGNIVDIDRNHILRLDRDGAPNWSRHNITNPAIHGQLQQLINSGKARRFSDDRAAKNAWIQAGGWQAAPPSPRANAPAPQPRTWNLTPDPGPQSPRQPGQGVR